MRPECRVLNVVINLHALNSYLANIDMHEYFEVYEIVLLEAVLESWPTGLLNMQMSKWLNFEVWASQLVS